MFSILMVRSQRRSCALSVAQKILRSGTLKLANVPNVVENWKRQMLS